MTLDDALIELEPTTTESIKLNEEEGGTFFFLIPVISENIGEQFSIPQGTQLDNTTLGADFILATAFTDFSEGKNTETTEELLARAKDEITVRDLVTTKSINAVLRDTFSFVENLAVIGLGDIEMIRDKFGGFGLGVGGKVDIFVRTSRDPVVNTLQKTVASNSTITLDLVGSEVPFYRIESISLLSTPDQELTDYSVDFFLANNPANELLDDPTNGRFSIYERATITFNSTAYNGKEVLIKINQPPQISTLQAFVQSDSERVVAADLLVRGIIPCFTKVEFNYVKKPLSTTIDLTEIKNAIKSYINNISPGETLNLSQIISIAHGFDVLRVDVPSLTVTGEVYTPANTIIEIEADNFLEIPFGREIGLSQKNTVYFITLDDIIITEVII